MRGFRRFLLPSVIKTTNAQLASDILSFGRSYAVSAPHDSQFPQKRNKKISKEVRLAMVEEFVKNYRSANAGKFPSIMATKQEVGGGYYSIRALVQRLMHESKTSSIEKNGFDSIKTVTDTDSHHENLPSSRVNSKAVSSFRRSGVSSGQISASGKKSFNIDPMLENSESVKVTPTGGRSSFGDQDLACDHNNHSATSLTSISKLTVRFPETSDTQDGSSSSSACVTSNHPLSKEDISKDDRNAKKIADAAESLPKEKTVWHALKSFADGILGRWKRL